MSRTIIIIGFLGIAFFAQVAAHGHLSAPITRDYLKIFSDKNKPNAYPLASDFVCRNDGPLDSSQWTTLTAGSSTNMTWSFEAAHPGDCFAYLSYDMNLPDTQKKWFKIAQWNDCNKLSNIPQTFTIPSYLPSADHAILRWEWYALHLQAINIVEFYSQCSDVKIVGSANGQIPTPQVTIPGHLPMDAKFYRNEDLNPDQVLFTGPPMATIGGADYSCLATYGSACVTPAPYYFPCNISSQRCVSETTFQGCGIGRTTTEWKDVQSCQTGLVCRPAFDNTRIICDRPSTPSTVPIPTPPSTPTPTPSAPTPTPAAPTPVPSAPAPTPTPTAPTPSAPADGMCTLRNMRCSGGALFQICTNGVSSNYWANQSCNAANGEVCVQNGDTVFCGRIPSASTTTGSSTAPVPAPAPATTGSTMPTSTTSSTSSVCNERDQRCSTTSTYQTCTKLRDGSTYWAPVQNCQSGSSCHANGNNIYCY